MSLLNLGSTCLKRLPWGPVQEPQLWLILGDLVDHNAGASISSQISSTTEAVKEKNVVTWWHVFLFFFSKAKIENLQFRGPLDKEIPFWKPSFLEFLLAFGGVYYITPNLYNNSTRWTPDPVINGVK